MNFALLCCAMLPFATQVASIQDEQAGGPRLVSGPIVGHVTPLSISVWVKAAEPRTVRLCAWPAAGGAARLSVQTATTEEADCTATLVLSGLKPDTLYRYSIDFQADAACAKQLARTAPLATSKNAVTLAFVSCAYEDEVTGAAWKALAQRELDLLFCIGDTPYIDTCDLAIQRRRYTAFNSFEPFAAIARRTPVISTWDDHDFGANDTDGNLEGKENARRAFIEHRPNPSFGDGKNAGIYTSLRHGPVEVFVLDARWYASTAPSPANPAAPTLLGADQWAWLCAGLKTSTAPVKVLLTGMVWNGAVRPNKTDHWGAYAEERDALFAFLGRERISGVVLVGGDIHRSRILCHPTDESVGYPLLEFISSPLHDRIIASANQPHPGLIADFGTPQTWLELRIDPCAPALVTASLRSASAEQLFEIALSAQQLSPGKAEGQER